MRLKSYLIPAILLIVLVSATWAGDDDVWVGTRFRPEQCLKIEEGKYDVKHKLGTITYQIQFKNDHYEVKARLRFNRQYIPENVSGVELQILLINENLECTQQLNIHKVAQAGQVDFSFVAQKLPNQRYVRTYFVIYYQ